MTSPCVIAEATTPTPRLKTRQLPARPRKEFIMTCPICGKPSTWKDNPDRPFCSERCKTIDLGNWATEEYTVSTPLIDPEETLSGRRPAVPNSPGDLDSDLIH